MFGQDLIVLIVVQIKTKSKPPMRARATLYGLSSIQRDGDVTVNVMSSHTTVKTKFLVGPLVLKVEKEVREIPTLHSETGE